LGDIWRGTTHKSLVKFRATHTVRRRGVITVKNDSIFGEFIDSYTGLQTFIDRRQITCISATEGDTNRSVVYTERRAYTAKGTPAQLVQEQEVWLQQHLQLIGVSVGQQSNLMTSSSGARGGGSNPSSSSASRP
jgi:hypothetical protein